jgi:transposase
MRQQRVKFRTAQMNGLRGLLAEYGEVMPRGRAALTQAIPLVLGRLIERLPTVLIETLREQYARIGHMESQIADIERRLHRWHREDEDCQRIAAIPGVGLLTATAAVATMGDPHAFRNGREFAAWLGLVPRQVGTGGHVKLLGISKRGDTYLRTLLIHGARSVLVRCRKPSAWMSTLLQRHSLNVAAVALANKMARTLWALMAHQRIYQSGYVSQPT